MGLTPGPEGTGLPRSGIPGEEVTRPCWVRRFECTGRGVPRPSKAMERADLPGLREDLRVR